MHRGTRSIVAATLATGLLLATAGQLSQAGADDTATEREVLRIGSSRSMPYALDPMGTAQAATASPMTNIFEPLVRREGEEYVGVLATEWENTDDLTWVITLREGVTFSDGSEMDSADVKASLDRLRSPDSAAGVGTLFTLIESVDATDPLTVTITTSEPMGTMLPSLTMFNVTSEEAIVEGGPTLQEEITAATGWVGTGPYVLEEHVSESEINLVKNPMYWDGEPAIDRLEYRYIPEVTARLTALETGEIDVTWNVAPDQLAQLEGNDDLTVEAPLSYKYYLAWYNAQQEVFSDARVRRAMNHAIDVEQIAADLFPDFGEVGTAPIPAGVFGHSAQEPYAYDPELARELLAEAGYPDGFEVSMQFQSACCPQIQALADTLVSYWAEIGVTVTATPMETATWGANLISLNYDISLQDNPTITGDADYTLGRLYANDAPDADAPYSGYDNEDLITLLLSARTTIDQAEREAIYAEAIELMWVVALGRFPLDLPLVYAFRSDVEGVELDPAERISFKDARVV